MNRFIHTPLEQLLTECLVHRDFANLAEIQRLYSLVNDQELFDFAEEHEIASIVGERLKMFMAPPAHWQTAIDTQAHIQQNRLAELERVATHLAENGIPLIALKNAGIATAIYPYPSECPMGDLDVLVKKSDFPRAHAILESDGYVLDFRVAETIEKKGLEAGLLSGGTEYQKDLGNNETLWFELQWRPVAGRWIAPDVEPGADELFQTAVAIPGSNIKLLDPINNLLQVSLHTAKHSYTRAPGLRLHTDVDRIVRHYDTPEHPFDWETFTNKVQSLHLKTAVYFSLAFAKQILHTPIPQRVLDLLQPPILQREAILQLLAKGGLFHPNAPKFSRVEYLTFTALLFDGPRECLRTAFPSRDYMKKHHNLRTDLLLPAVYSKRFIDLLTKRVRT